MESMFQFTNPALTGLEFGLNQGFNSKENKEVQIQINMSVSVNRNGNRNEAEGTLKIELGEKSPEMPFYRKPPGDPHGGERTGDRPVLQHAGGGTVNAARQTAS